MHTPMSVADAPSTSKHATIVYKVLGAAEWQAAERAGAYAGSSDDARDGFIHLSTATQLAGTVAKHFSGRGDLVVVAIDAGKLGERLKWEPSRGGELFPHLYGLLDPAAAIKVAAMVIGPDGAPALPMDLLACSPD